MKIVKKQGVSGMNIKLMKVFAQKFDETIYSNGIEVVLMFDNLKAHLNQGYLNSPF